MKKKVVDSEASMIKGVKALKKLVKYSSLTVDAAIDIAYSFGYAERDRQEQISESYSDSDIDIFNNL